MRAYSGKNPNKYTVDKFREEKHENTSFQLDTNSTSLGNDEIHFFFTYCFIYGAHPSFNLPQLQL